MPVRESDCTREDLTKSGSLQCGNAQKKTMKKIKAAAVVMSEQLTVAVEGWM